MIPLSIFNIYGSAKTITVNDDGNADYNNIADAIINSNDNDIIFIHNGTYKEGHEDYFSRITINKSITLIGESKFSTIIRDRLYIYDSSVKIYNISFQELGISIDWSDNIIIENNIVDNCSHGIFIEDSKDIAINDNIITNCSNGVSGYGDNVIIDGNIINSNNIGIDYSFSDNSIISNNVIDSNNEGIQLWGNSEIKNCTISSNEYGIIIMECDTLKLPNTIIENNTVGIRFYHTTASLEEGNIKNSKKYDFELFRSQIKIIDTKFDENKIYFDDYYSKIELSNKTLGKYTLYGLIDIFSLFGIIIASFITFISIYDVIKTNKNQRIYKIKRNFLFGVFIIYIYSLGWILFYFEGFWIYSITIIPGIIFPSLIITFIVYNMKSDLLEDEIISKDKISSEVLYWEKNELRKKQNQIIILLSIIYILILITIIIPTIIKYNEYWADGHSGARSPIGSGAECCAIFLLILFILIFIVSDSIIKYRLKKSIKEKYDLINQDKSEEN